MRLAGLSACVPAVSTQSAIAYEKFPRLEVERIINNIGVIEKRDAEPGTTATDLCVAAAIPLIAKLGWTPDSIDAVILVTTSPDYMMPASAHLAHRELGLGTRCFAFDINLGCSGFTHGLIVMQSLMASGLLRRALLLCGDATANTFRPALKDLEHRSDLGNALLFGDAGTATALEASESSQVHSFDYGAEGSGMEHIMVPGGAFRCAWGPELFVRKVDDRGDERRPLDLILRGPEVLAFSMKRVPPLLDDLLDRAKWNRDEVDAFVMHQANKFMLDFLARRMKLPIEKVLMSIEEFGNTSSASIPLTMLTRAPELLAKRAKWALMGFGVGLSWSGITLETDGVVTVPLIDHRPSPRSQKTPDPVAADE